MTNARTNLPIALAAGGLLVCMAPASALPMPQAVKTDAPPTMQHNGEAATVENVRWRRWHGYRGYGGPRVILRFGGPHWYGGYPRRHWGGYPRYW